MKTMKNLAFTTTIALALIVQLVNPIPVRADGETPQPTDAPEVTSTPAPEEMPTEVAATEPPIVADTPTESAATESPVAPDAPTAEPVIINTSAPPTDVPTEATEVSSTTATEEPAHSETPAAATDEPVASATPAPATDLPTEVPTTSETAATMVPTEPTVVEQPTILETVQQMPEETSVVVLDETGQPLPLASQDAAAVIEAGDPMWCPANTTPGGSGCSSSYGSLLDLVNNFVPSGDGTIWIADGIDSSSSTIIIDGNGNWTVANMYTLTLQGGVGGVTSTFNVPIAIYNWNNDVTLNDISINNTTIAGHGLTIDTSGNINLQNVNSNGNVINPGDGAYLDNTRGTGNVVVTGHNNFSTHNQWNSGMYIVSNGDVWLDHVTANNNGRGVNISQAGSVVVTNSTFNDNSYDFDGVYIVANGDVSLDGLTASNNGNGAYIAQAGRVVVTNSTFNNNLHDGFYINATGDVHVGGVGADHNGDNGAYVVNSGALNISQSFFTQNWVGAFIRTEGDATVASSSFSNNLYDGLRIFAIGNQVLLNNSQFNNNNQIGADGYGAWVSAGSTGDITVLNSEFNNNYAGLVAFSSNNIYILKDVVDNQFQYNALGIGYYDCRGTLVLDPLVAFLGNDYDIFNWGGCPDPVSTTSTGPILPPILATGGKFSKYVDCSIQAPPPVSLPNGDLVEVHCPINGILDIARLDSTTLPAPLPEGYTYASAFDVKIHNKSRIINVIPNGGSITASFLANYLQSGNAFSILFWDETNQQWIQLKDYLIEGNAARKFYLDSEDKNPRREIKSGVRLITRYRSPRVEVEVNFPGTFVLVQH